MKMLRANRGGVGKIRGTLLGVPIIRTIVFGGLYWGPLILGNYQIGLHEKHLWVYVREWQRRTHRHLKARFHRSRALHAEFTMSRNVEKTESTVSIRKR